MQDSVWTSVYILCNTISEGVIQKEVLKITTFIYFFPFFPISRENLNQWEKVTRGEEAFIWIPSQSLAPETSDSLPVKIDD